MTQRSVNVPGNISFVGDTLKLLVLHGSRFGSGMSPAICSASKGSSRFRMKTPWWGGMSKEE